VESELGKGSTFNVYLPQVEAEAPERPQQRRKKPGGRHGSETVLLVEDEEAVRVLARRVLKAQGYHVLEARRTGDAIRLAETYPGPIPLMVTDIVMPQMSGPDLARRLAASRPEMKVLFMSGYPGGSVDQLQGLDAAATFIQKPFTSATLSRKVRELLDSSSSSARHIKP